MTRRDSAFAILCRRKCVLLVKPRDGRHWQLPGGGIKASETPWVAVLREVQEETGLEARLLGLAGMYLPGLWKKTFGPKGLSRLGAHLFRRAVKGKVEPAAVEEPQRQVV
jgi:8-oxo-dGTP pyrophosphatase MutT (NUDIX family)